VVKEAQTAPYYTVINSRFAANALRFRKPKLVPLHIHAHPAKCHAFHAQPEFLLSAIFSAQLDGPAGADNAVPGQSRNLAQNPYHLTRCSGPARSLG
jgi:hypothetical protein